MGLSSFASTGVTSVLVVLVHVSPQYSPPNHSHQYLQKHAGAVADAVVVVVVVVVVVED